MDVHVQQPPPVPESGNASARFNQPPWQVRFGAGPSFYAVFLLSVLLGLCVRPYAFTVGPIADDYAQLGMLKGYYPSARSAFDLFDFNDGTSADLSRLTRSGFFPWWSHPQLRLSMWRPLSSGLMWFDLHVFGENFRLHHIHTGLWWVALVWVVATIWRRALPFGTFTLALALFVVDEAHGVLLAWLANRNAVAGSVFALAALSIYVSLREGDRRRGYVWVVLSYTLALGFGEYALTFVGYFIAYEWFRGQGNRWQRIRSLTAIFVPVGAFLGARALLGYGPRNSGIYVDPSVEPLQFLAAAAQRIPIFAADLSIALRSDYWTFGLPWTDSLVRARVVPFEWSTSLSPWRQVHLGVGTLALGVCVALSVSTLRGRSRRDPLWWLSIGAALSLIPAAAPFPSSRLVVAALVGFCPVLATFVAQNIRKRRSAPIAAALLVLHATIPTWQTFTETRNLSFAADAVRSAVRGMHVDNELLPRQRMVVMNAVDASLGFYIPLIRRAENLPAPERCWVLSGSPTPMSLIRTSLNAFTLIMVAGQSATGSSYEQMFRAFRDPLQVGDVFDVDGMRVEVLSAREGGFVSARFAFDRSLDDPSLVFVRAGPSGIERLRMPAVGQSVYIPSPTYASAMAP